MKTDPKKVLSRSLANFGDTHMLPNQFLILLIVLLGLITFAIGILVGYSIKVNIRHRLSVRQNHGEASVRNTILSCFKPPDYHLLNNITLPFQDGTTQIDHVLVSTKGIFVIETKDYSGWIFGNEESNQWTQTIYRVKNRFQNPIHQNYKHVIAVRSLLDFVPESQIHSVVIFTGSAVFKTPVPQGVVYLNQLESYLSSYETELLSLNRVEYCVGRLECRRYEVTNRTDLQHRAYLVKKFGESR